MKKVRNNLSKLIPSIVMLLLIIFCSFFVSSCGEDDGIHNDRELIEKFVTGYKLSDFNDVKNSYKDAISKYKNKTIDPEPVLVLARIDRVTENPKATLSILTYDEDGDLSGITIKEKRLDSRGNEVILEEDYPIFTFWRPPNGAFIFLIFNQIRKNGQTKSEEDWRNYIEGVSIDTGKIANVSNWARSLPELFVSVPEPNEVEVEMYLYDKAGHKSKPILLRHIELE